MGSALSLPPSSSISLLIPQNLKRYFSSPLIIDTDGALDDLAAIATLLSQNLLLITTVRGGCTDSGFSAEMIRRFLDASGKASVPVVQGRNLPFDGFDVPSWLNKHQEKLKVAAKIWGLYDPPIETLDIVPNLELQAASAIVEAVKVAEKDGKKTTILALGPLTNIALALQLDPAGMKSGVGEIIFSGDYVMKASSESGLRPPFNIRLDEASFWCMLKSGIPVTLCQPTNMKEEKGNDWNPLHAVNDSWCDCWPRRYYMASRRRSLAAQVLNFLATVPENKNNLTAVCQNFEDPNMDINSKFTGVEIVHLKQDPVTAFYVAKRKAFTSAIVDDLGPEVSEHNQKVRRVSAVNCEDFAAWIRGVAAS